MTHNDDNKIFFLLFLLLQKYVLKLNLQNCSYILVICIHVLNINMFYVLFLIYF